MTATADFNEFDCLRPQRLEPLKAFRAFRRLARNKEDTSQVFEIMRALSGRSIGRGYTRMLQSLEGGRQAFLREELAREGVDVRGVKTDPERLTALVLLGIRDDKQFPLIFYRENCADMAQFSR